MQSNKIEILGVDSSYIRSLWILGSSLLTVTAAGAAVLVTRLTGSAAGPVFVVSVGFSIILLSWISLRVLAIAHCLAIQAIDIFMHHDRIEACVKMSGGRTLRGAASGFLSQDTEGDQLHSVLVVHGIAVAGIPEDAMLAIESSRQPLRKPRVYGRVNTGYGHALKLMHDS